MRHLNPAQLPFLALALCAIALAGAAAVCGQPEDETGALQDAPTAGQTALTATVELGTASATAETSATEPQATPMPEATPTQAVAQFPTPSSPSDEMFVGGTIWVNARPAFGEVLAFINGQRCGRAQSGVFPSEPQSSFPFFAIGIASDAETPGCGVPGSEITITIDGRAMNETMAWQPGFQQPRSFVSGPAFGNYGGILRLGAGIRPASVVPYVGGIVCGEQLDLYLGPDGWSYQVAVDPEELKPGCGRPGATVTFRLVTDGQGDGDLGASPWETGSLVQRGAIDIAAPIEVTPPPSNETVP